jgi:hypothetical protein
MSRALVYLFLCLENSNILLTGWTRPPVNCQVWWGWDALKYSLAPVVQVS